MNIKNKNVLCIGEVLWDRFPAGSKPGGASLNTGVHLNNLGAHVVLASRVGKDQSGKKLSDFLSGSGLSCDWIQEDDRLATSEVLVRLDENRNATYEICKPVAWDNIQFTYALKNAAKNSGILVYGSLASRSEVTRETILRVISNDAFKIMDVNLRKPYDQREVVELLMAKANLVKINDDELKIVASWHHLTNLEEKAQLQRLTSIYNLQMICVTKGSNGAVIYHDKKLYEHPGFKVKAVDTVGAGDAFLAGLIHSLLAENPMEKVLEFACALGALVASKMGATPKIEMEQISEILSSNK